MLMMSLLISVGIVLPQPAVPAGTDASSVAQAFKKVAVTYAIGFLVTGIALTLTPPID